MYELNCTYISYELSKGKANYFSSFQVRGFKSVIRLFTHNVSDLEVILKMLSEQSPSGYQV